MDYFKGCEWLKEAAPVVAVTVVLGFVMLALLGYLRTVWTTHMKFMENHMDHNTDAQTTLATSLEKLASSVDSMAKRVERCPLRESKADDSK